MSFVPGVVSRNWRLKLAAFGLSVFLWAVVKAEPDGVTTQTVSGVPVVVQVADVDWTLADSARPSEVEVRIAGSFGGLDPAPRDLRVQVPIDSVSAEDSVVQLRRDWVVSGSGETFQTEAIAPTRVHLTFERTRRVAVPISLRTIGSLPREVALAQPLGLNPAVVSVRGRVSRIEQLDSIPARPLDLGALDESGTVRLPLDTTGFGDLTFLTSEVAVEVRLEEAVERVLELSVRPDSVLPGVDSVELALEPPTVRVALRGGRTRVAQATDGTVEATVPHGAIRELRPGEQRVLPLRIRGIPDLVRADPEVDSVRVIRALAEADTMTAGSGPSRGGGR